MTRTAHRAPLRAAAFAAAMALGLAAHAGAASADQLEDIRERGAVRIAIDLGNPPFAMMDARFEPTGSEVETARLLAQDLGVELEFLKVPTSGRIPFLVSGKADIVVSTLSITPDRLEVVDFSAPYSMSTIIVAGPGAAAIADYADLAGTAVAVTRGTVNDTNLTENTADVAGARIVRFEDDATASAAVSSGQFSVYATSRPLLRQLKASAPGLDIEEKFVARSYPLGIAVRKGEPELVAWLNRWIGENLANGRLVDVYEKFHGVRPDPAQLAAMDVPR